MKEIFIERHEKIVRIAVKTNGQLSECYIEEENNEPKVSNIYKGVVQNIVPSIKSAFIDIGTKKNAYMYLKGDLKTLKKGQEVLVEVIKEQSGKKGAKVTENVNFPGNYVVLSNGHKELRFSPKIKDDKFKENAMINIHKPENIGVVLRTGAYGVQSDEINREIQTIYSIYENVTKKFTYSKNIGLLYDNDGIIGNILKGLKHENYKVIVNNLNDFNFCKEILEYKFEKVNLEIYEDAISLFNYFGIEKEILSLRNNKVNLPSGGNIVIEKTEAMHVIDVNSAKNTKNSSMKKTIFETNLEAAEIIADQIKLRNISGIVVVDFIDMKESEEKKIIIEELKKHFKNDKNKVSIYDFTELNLVQIARRRSGKSIFEYIFEKCTSCNGKGVKVKLSYIETMIQNNIERLKVEQDVKNMYIEINDIYKNEIKSDILSFVKNIHGLDKNIYVNYVHGIDTFKIEPLIFNSQIKNLHIYKVYPEEYID
ncbi:Rne/Rng family ribonuclease [Clostridium senegalense]|uniref:Rne/Rng family ribonuclease n=1 Tax=Clostridium senegalense TaxID=1465809 RepID=A0A6M0GZX7_9CLOT|nr:Rne/Rng family ribonuclease [Clostridium senegalense]NEU03383.1 Rne/Rng family ribonuclease [Clostridium senegalense]